MSSPPDTDVPPPPAGTSGSPFVEPAGAQPAGEPPGEFGVVLRVTLWLFAIGFAVWVIFAFGDYRKHYVLATENWHRGAKNFIEITLVREDHVNLDCAADATVRGLHCAFGADQPPRAGADDDLHVLRPYNTVNGELFLGAGLWRLAGATGALPAGRFTVICDFDIVGALRSVALRWARNGSFDPNERSLAGGRAAQLRDPAMSVAPADRRATGCRARATIDGWRACGARCRRPSARRRSSWRS